MKTTSGRRVLAVASSGGHFNQLVRLVDRVPNVGGVTWVTYDTGLERDLLAAAGRQDDPLVFAPYAAPRDVPNLVRDAVVVQRVLRATEHHIAISTGAGIAVAGLPVARARGLRAIFIESATRAEGPSLSGRLLQRMPGVELYTQNPGYPPRWRDAGSVHDEFVGGAQRQIRQLRRVVVTLGTIRPYGFRRLVERLLRVLPAQVEVLWQTGATDVTDLPIDARATIPQRELQAAIAEADVVVAHAGTGTALTAFELGRCPVLVPRRHAAGEHIDDHQVVTAEALAARGLAVHVEVEDLSSDVLLAAARRAVVRNAHIPPLRL